MSGPDSFAKPAYPVVSVISADAEIAQKKLQGTPVQQKSWANKNKWLITGIVLLVAAVIAISVSVTSIDGSSSVKSNTPVGAPSPAPTKDASAEIYQLPPPDQWDPTQWEGLAADYYKQLNDSVLLTPENIKKFMTEARQFLKEKFNVTLAEYVGSPKTILHYLQASQQWDIIQAILTWAQGRDLTSINFEDLLNLVEQLKSAFNEDRLFEFNKGMSVAHEYVAGKINAEEQEMSMNDLIGNLTTTGFNATDAEAQIMADRQFQTARLTSPPKKSPTKSKKSPPKTPKKSPAKVPPKKSPAKVPPKKSPPKAAPAKSPPKAPATNPPATPAPIKGFQPMVIPLVLHVMQYKSQSGSKVVALPPTYDATQAANNIVTQVNKTFKKYGTSVQFRIGEVRADVNKYPYLLVNTLEDWQALAAEGMQYLGVSFLEKNNLPVDRFINVYIAGSFNIPQAPCMSLTSGIDCGRGYAWVAPIISCASTEQQKWQHVLIMHDEFSLSWYNKDWGGYTPGAVVLAHELGHHLGLDHTHKGLNKFPYGCSQPNDAVADTPENDDAQSQKWWDQADNLCQDYLDGSNVNWSLEQKKFDSCPKSPGTDAIFNILSYSPDTCRSILNLGLTPKQVLYMQMKVLNCRPKMYSCTSGSGANCYSG